MSLEGYIAMKTNSDLSAYTYNFNLGKENEYPNIFYGILLNKIRNCCSEYISGDISSPFYQYLFNKDAFAKHRINYDAIKRKHKQGIITSMERDSEMEDVKRKIVEQNDTILYSFAYSMNNHICPAIPLIILDDLDPLHTKVQTYIFTEIYSLSHTYGIKVIVSMRPRSYKIVSQRITEAIQINNQIVFKSSHIDFYLAGKFKNLYTQIVKYGLSNDQFVTDQFTWDISNIKHFFDVFYHMSLNKDVLIFLKNLSGGNLRKLNNFIEIYLSSGYIDRSDTISKAIMGEYMIRPDRSDVSKAIIGEYPIHSDSQMLPLWIIYSAIFTNNYETVFGMVIPEPDKYVVNILCNGTASVNTYLIRLHLLSFFYRSGSAPFSLSAITERYKGVVEEGDTLEMQNALARALKRLNNFNLLGNNTILEIPEANDPNSIHDQIDESVEFYMEELGRYYYDSITSIFEYFHYMKDDINFKKENDILSCIETKIDNPLKFEQVIKYFEILFEEEKLFYERLSEEKRTHYKKYFAPYNSGDKIFYVQVFVNNMINYARTRTYTRIDDIKSQLSNLKSRIDDTVKAYT